MVSFFEDMANQLEGAVRDVGSNIVTEAAATANNVVRTASASARDGVANRIRSTMGAQRAAQPTLVESEENENRAPIGEEARMSFARTDSASPGRASPVSETYSNYTPQRVGATGQELMDLLPYVVGGIGVLLIVGFMLRKG